MLFCKKQNKQPLRKTININLFIFLILLGMGVFGLGINVQAISPILNFSDIVNGPSSGLNDGLGEGVIITVWGNNLGSSQGNSMITIGGKPPAYIYYWKNADGQLPGGPADLYASHKMQEIAFSIPSSLSNGNYDIKVVVNGNESNVLPFTVRNGNIYHAKTVGSVDGDGSFNNPWLSWRLGGAYEHMIAGDILYLHDNTFDVATTKHIISGKVGTINNQYAIISYPNSRYLLQAPEACIDMYNSNSFVFSKIVCKSGAYNEPDISSTVDLGTTKSGIGIEGAPNGRLIANEITEINGKCSSGWQGAIVASCGGSNCDPISNLKVFGNYIHDWGCPQTSHFEHTTYFSIRNNGYVDVEPWEIGWNYLKDNQAKFGLHNYDETYSTEPNRCGSPTGIVKIHDNYIINQKGPGISIGSKAGVGATCWDSGQFDIYNNIIIESGKGPEYTDFHSSALSGIQIRDAGLSMPIKIFNNTIYSTGDDLEGIRANILIQETGNSGYLDLKINNNIVFDTRGGTYTEINEVAFPNVSGSNNLFFSTKGILLNDTVDSRFTNNIFQDPLFNNAIAKDFCPQSTSPTIDAGTSDVSSIVTKDFLGNPRPQGNGWDIGAFEYQETNQTPTTYNLSNFTSLINNWLNIGDSNSDVNNDGIVNTRDLGIMMSHWE